MSKLLYTVKEIFSDENDGYLKIQGKVFYQIPLYQRGYKWKKTEVIKLLEDINHFKPEGQKFYCLQNITLVPSKNNGYLNVVDGQQRLATLIVILSYLRNKELVRNKIQFPDNSIRKETNKFIKEIVTSDTSELTIASWDELIERNPEYDHQDIYYLYHAQQAVIGWFTEKKIDEQIFTNKLLNNVQLIMNNISEESKEEKIFGNLNSKRIPLDGADLVRAILITRVAYEEGKNDTDIKNIVRVNERRVRIGWELDEINHWWSREDIKNYFKRFISITSDEVSVGNKLFKEERYPINYLLLLFAEKNGRGKLSLEFLEERTNNALELYKELIKLNTTLKDWFNDREIYHYLGFLFAQSKIKFNEIWELWTTGLQTRNEFKTILKKKIKDIVLSEDTAISLQNDNTNWYEAEQESLLKILILMDIIWSIKTNQAFLPASTFERKGHDIEHIFPQNPQEIKDKLAYIKFLNKYYLEEPVESFEENFEDKMDDSSFQTEIEEFILKYTSQIKINSIGNLVLLDASKNRSFGNNLYSVKRAALVEEINKGTFMRPHTLKVFVRYFETGDKENKDNSLWTNADIDQNAKEIENELKTFFGL